MKIRCKYILFHNVRFDIGVAILYPPLLEGLENKHKKQSLRIYGLEQKR